MDYKEPITDEELYACPISEELRVLDLYFALQILKMDVYGLDDSFLTSMHKEMINHMMQRGTMASKVLLTPNFCAELFTLKEYDENNRYIVNKLVGRHDYQGNRIPDFNVLERQTRRKIMKLAEDNTDGYLIFFWDRQPNLIKENKTNEWAFYPESPAYKSLVAFYGKHKVVERMDY